MFLFKLLLSAVCIAWVLPAGYAGAKAPGRKPNIIYINADDLGWTDLGYRGSTYYRTPNIDKLASQGMTFSDAYAPAANCAPSRACCMTGQYTPRHGIYTVGSSERGKAKDRKLIPTKNTTVLADEHVTIAETLKDAGYITCHVGKWHLGPDPTTQGFDVNIAGCEWGSPSGGGYHSPYKYPNCVQTKKGEYLTDRLGTEAIAFIEKHKDQPFFLHFATHSVHTPLQAKADLIAVYSNRAPTEAHSNPTYAAMIQSLDENVGRIMQKIDELGLADNTLVLFTSDNGGVWKTSKQWPLRAGKGSYFEGGIREPMIVRWPGKVEPGSTCDVPVSGIDFFPTFLDAAGAEAPDGKTLDGVSLMPLLTQAGAIEDRPLFWHFPIYLQGYFKKGHTETRDLKFRTRPGSAVRRGDWKLHERFEDGGLELYNLKQDIGEKNNLADAEPEKTRELHELLKAWRKQTGAPVPTELSPEYEK
jgi:arylsulfatase A-like enzyme